MATFKNDVIEIEKLKNDKGDYLEIKIQKEDGEVLEKKIFGPAVKDFTVPGLYEVVNSKNSKGYWVVDSAKLLQPAQEGHKPSETHKTAPGRDFDTNRNILIQSVMKSAATAYSGHPGTPDHAKILELAKMFLDFAEKALSAKIEDVPL